MAAALGTLNGGKMQNSTEHGVRNIEVFAEATTISGWRKQAIAGQPDAGRFAFVADEGDYMPGGEGTAPTPLSYFVAGLAMCILSQVSNIAFRKKLAIRNERVNILARFLETGSILKGDKEGEAVGFEIELSIDSDEDEKEIMNLMRMAHRMCFAEDSLTRAMKLELSHSLNGKEIHLS
ncbi:MAG: OsmC-related (seleno)protein [Anaerolineales bacterium]